VPILKRYGATKVILFGSLASGTFRRESDIDLAVEGIPARCFTRALADLMMALDWPVDLKPLEDVEPEFRERVLREGIILHEAAA
jgi:predicted nucleotidyltransferase